MSCYRIEFYDYYYFDFLQSLLFIAIIKMHYHHDHHTSFQTLSFLSFYSLIGQQQKLVLALKLENRKAKLENLSLQKNFAILLFHNVEMKFINYFQKSSVCRSVCKSSQCRSVDLLYVKLPKICQESVESIY